MAGLSSRRDLSAEASHNNVLAVGGRRNPFFVLDDQAVEDQYLFTSLRFDRKEKSSKLNPICCKEAKNVYLFKYHFDRLKDSAKCRGWYDAEKCLKRPLDLFNRVEYAVADYEKSNGGKGPYKVRIRIRYHGNLQIDVTPDSSGIKKPLLYPSTLDLHKHPHEAASRSDTFQIVLDTLPTTKSLHTRSKTEWRPMYEYARFAAGIETFADPKEVLLYNMDGELMDGSICTPYFFRNGRWVTPHTSCGGQTGTTRRWAIDQNLCTMATIQVDSLRHDETIWLSNSVKGFFTARFVASPNRCNAPSYRFGPLSTHSSLASFLTVVDTPISERDKGLSWPPDAIEADDLEEISPHNSWSQPPPPQDNEHNPNKANEKPLFKMPLFGGTSPDKDDGNEDRKIDKKEGRKHPPLPSRPPPTPMSRKPLPPIPGCRVPHMSPPTHAAQLV